MPKRLLSKTIEKHLAIDSKDIYIHAYIHIIGRKFGLYKFMTANPGTATANNAKYDSIRNFKNIIKYYIVPRINIAGTWSINEDRR
jgi:hypothetical protein